MHIREVIELLNIIILNRMLKKLYFSSRFVNLPIPIKSSNILLRWWQPVHSGFNDLDTWAIDEVIVDSYKLTSGFYDNFQVRINLSNKYCII